MLWDALDPKHYYAFAHGCIPPEVGVEQAITVLKKYLVTHPENLHKGDSILVRVALVEAFPCKT